jgi:phenylacetate-CoA ligase
MDEMSKMVPKLYDIGMRALDFLRIKRIWHWKKRLQKEELWDDDKIDIARKRRARVLIDSLHANPYYVSVWPEVQYDISNPLGFLSQFPILTREIVRDRYDNGLFTRNQKMYARLDSTSGSTGIPLKFAKDQRTEDFKLATEILFSEYTGWKFGQTQAALWAKHHETISAKLWNNVFMRRRQLPPYYETPKGWNLARKSLREFNPHLITGYSSALYSFAKHFIGQSQIAGSKLSGVIASAESLYPAQKETVEEAFGCDVFMRYGTRELDNLGMECREHTGYHLLDSRYMIEIVDATGEHVEEGEIGRIVVTDLMNRVFPLIRYDTGDEGSII